MNQILLKQMESKQYVLSGTFDEIVCIIVKKWLANNVTETFKFYMLWLWLPSIIVSAIVLIIIRRHMYQSRLALIGAHFSLLGLN